MISPEIISFIDQTEEIFNYSNLENLKTIYHYSVPNVKLSYPEPFIASASFMHSDLWFVHILIYQYWLWFVFIFIIVFFFITFICTVRWCNMRIRPRRETRGVSRSKCGDLITACVPVSWATSIIVNESTDAIDYYDGFGTTELVVGIRAYQWGWEYYYPKDIDLNYNIKKNYSTFIGNSLKYNKTTELNISTNNLWKFYQNKNFDQTITPAYLLLLPIDNSKLLNFLNFNDIGSNSLYESNAFKRIRMFSKTYSSNLFFTNNNYSNKYHKLTNLYLDSNSFIDSSFYGLKRQQNFLSNESLFFNQINFLNKFSFNKLISFNFQNYFFNHNLNNNFDSKLTFSKNTNIFDKINIFFMEKNINKNSINVNKGFFNNFIIYNNYLEKINDNTDKKKINYPVYKLFNSIFKKNYLNNYTQVNLINSSNDFFLLKNINNSGNFFNNKNLTYKAFSLTSPNQSVGVTDKSIRNFLKISPNVSNLNYSKKLNSISNYLLTSKNKSELNNFFFFNLSNVNWIDLTSHSKLISTKLNIDYPYSPINSNNLVVTPFNYDSYKHTFLENTPTVLQTKEELMPNFLTNIYWNFYWSGTTVDWRINNVNIFNLINKNFYFPKFNFYYDYDFRNWQSFELIEDSYWESLYSVYTFDEYLSLVKNFYDYEYFEKQGKLFNTFNRIFQDKFYKNKVSTLNSPFLKTTNSTGEIYLNSFYLEDFLNSPQNTLTKDFFLYPLLFSYSNNEENYESFKNLSFFFNNENLSIFNFSLNYFSSLTSSTVFDFFRSDFDEFSWFFDDTNFNKNFFFINENFKKASHFFENLSDFLTLEISHNAMLDKNNRFSNFINLRNTAKNSLVTHNAIQKVFRTRFDENRSHVKFTDLSNFYSKQPFISSPKTPYEKSLGKNKENFYKNNFYKNNFKHFFNNFYSFNTSLNFYFYDFPFLMALKSDPSRYLWFDWYAKWGFYEVQPSSSSRYAIYGMPYFSKNFEFSGTNNENFNETENYLTRISRARKNYLPNWTYSPYFYAKNNVWYKNNIIFNNFNNFSFSNSIINTKYILFSMNWYWTNIFFLNFHVKQFFPSNSNINSYSRNSWKPHNSIQNYYYTVSNLIDILSKREYLIRELFLKNNKIINIPFYLTNSPKNPLISEIKSNFLFTDSIVRNNEYSKNVYFNTLNFYNFFSINHLLTNVSFFFGLKSLSDLIFYYFFDYNLIENLNINSELYKNQYRPLRKGITNMIRLHATGAMALPIEIRIQILASSKDVIHSWAIPSAGIKIDCVPGYSSHRVMIFLVSGIFWGQCMEICGRYHHWMPIIVYFMKRDLFFLWCTHFIFLSGSNNQWNINDKQYSDYIRLASFDKNTWLTELQY